MNEGNTLESLLKNGETVVYPSRGFSMYPLIREKRDLLILTPLDRAKLRRFDCILFQNGSDYIMHRIIRFTSDGYVTRGDNRRTPEQVGFNEAIGVLSGLRRGDKLISQSSVRRFGLLWSVLFPIRWVYMVLRTFKNNLKRRMRK